jgi:hypothetical protein
MQRRQLLRGVGGLSAISVAGCLGSGSGNSGDSTTGSVSTGPTPTETPEPTSAPTETPEPTATPTETPEPTTTDQQDDVSRIRQNQAVAAQSLQSNVDTFLAGGDEQANKVGTEEASEKLKTAQRILDELDSGETVDRLGRANEWLFGLVTGIRVFNRGYVRFLNSIRQNRKDEIDAATKLADAATRTFAKAEKAFNEVAKVGEELRKTKYAERNSETFSAGATVLKKMHKSASAQESLSSGFSDQVSGSNPRTNGFVRYNNRQYSEARSRFADAKRFYDSAYESYSTARSQAPQEAKPVIDVFLCRAKALYDAMNHLETAALAANRDRPTLAEEEWRAGQKKMDKSCSTR